MACITCGRYAAPHSKECDDCLELKRLSAGVSDEVRASNPLIRAVEEDDQSTHPVRAPTRQEVREFFAYQWAKARELAAAGGNPQHVFLDHSDSLDRFGARIPIEDQAAFTQMFTDEIKAESAHRENVMQGEVAKQVGAAWTANQIGATVVSIILFFMLTMMFKACD